MLVIASYYSDRSGEVKRWIHLHDVPPICHNRASPSAESDPGIVAGWMAEVKGGQLAAERELAEAGSDGPLSADEVRRLVDSLRAIPEVLADALKAKVYSELGCGSPTNRATTW